LAFQNKKQKSNNIEEIERRKRFKETMIQPSYQLISIDQKPITDMENNSRRKAEVALGKTRILQIRNKNSNPSQ
jgi:hypothetical protein